MADIIAVTQGEEQGIKLVNTTLLFLLSTPAALLFQGILDALANNCVELLLTVLTLVHHVSASAMYHTVLGNLFTGL
eukprot:402569-Ditylum_brightwellii.AAC.1